jgi:hypothetical protein
MQMDKQSNLCTQPYTHQGGEKGYTTAVLCCDSVTT